MLSCAAPTATNVILGHVLGSEWRLLSWLSTSARCDTANAEYNYKLFTKRIAG